MKYKWLDNLSMVLVAVGGLNWGLIGFANFNLVGALGLSSFLTNTIYALVGLATLWLLYMTFSK